MKKTTAEKKANSLHIQQSKSERDPSTVSRSNERSGKTAIKTEKGQIAIKTKNGQTAIKPSQPRQPPHSELNKPSSTMSSILKPPLPVAIPSKESPPRPRLLKKTPAKKLAPKRVLSQRSHAHDPMRFITETLDLEWNSYTKYLRAFQEKSSVKNVRDLRVSIRRLMTSIDLIERFTPDNMLLRARGTLKEQLSELSDLRDAHMEMVAARRFLRELPELKEFDDALLERESGYLSTAKKVLSKSDKKFIENAINRVKIRISATRATTNATGANKILETAIDNSFDVVNKKLEFVNLATYSTIHNVRIAFKPFRYMLEMLQPLIKHDRKKLATARLLARMMGQVQDLEVLMKDLVEFRWKKESAQRAVIEIWLELERQQTETAQRFLKALPKFGTIWKPIIHEPSTTKTIDEKTLYVLRHGIAVNRGDAIYPLDSDRPLTSKGIKKIRKIAAGMHRLNVNFDVILTSPYRRAIETAFLVGREYGRGEAVQSTPALKPEVLPEEVIRVLQDRYAPCRNLLLIGHEPQLSALISTLTSGSAGVRPVLKKGGLCKLQVEKLEAGKCATLLWLLTPKQLSNIS